MKGAIPYYGANGIQGHINDYLFDEDLILLAEDGGYFDEYQSRPIAYNISGKSWVNNHAHVLRVNSNFCFSYVFYCLQHKNIMPFIKGGTRSKLNKSELLEITIWNPPLATQQKIAMVLSTIDNQIEQSQELIEKYTAIKQGLMADLFSRGIDVKTKKLRPSYQQEPNAYHKTELGCIPKGWQLKPIEHYAGVIDPNPSHRNPIYITDGFPFISTVEFVEGDNIEKNTNRRVDESTVIEQEKRCNFNENSIVFSRKGTIGEIRFLPTDIRFALLDSLCVINPKHINENFLFHILKSEYVLSQIRHMTMGQALPQMSIGRVRDILLAVPEDSTEQRLIGDKIENLSELIRVEINISKKLKAQKKGLMQDLLTGKKSVDSLPDSILAPVSSPEEIAQK